MTLREEVELWERRDVTIDFVCACLIMCGGLFILGCCI